jgi:UDP:flavonoid glycosyltransferase YjiC (YdhE family)
VPFAFDQPNNARRLELLGVAKMSRPGQRGAEALAEALRRLLAGNAPERVALLGGTIRREDGVGRSCAVLEETFAPHR